MARFWQTFFQVRIGPILDLTDQPSYEPYAIGFVPKRNTQATTQAEDSEILNALER